MEAWIVELKASILEGDEASLSALLDGKASWFKAEGWSILGSITEAISDIELDERGKANFQMVLNYLVKNGNPKETLFSLLEACQAFQSTSLFVLVLPSLYQTVSSLPLKHLSLDIILDTVSSHIKGLHWNDDYCLTTEKVGENETLTAQAKGSTIAELLFSIEQTVIELATPLWRHFSTEYSISQREMFIEFLLKFLDYPLLYLYVDNAVSTCCLTVLKLLLELVPTLSTLLERHMNHLTDPFTANLIYPEPVRNALEKAMSLFGISHMCYIIFCENLCADSFPCVYTAQHSMLLLLPHLNVLYRLSANSVIVHKVQRLMHYIMERIPSESLDEKLASLPSLRNFVPYSFWCMQYCELTPLRKTAACLLKGFTKKFTAKGRFFIYNWVLETEQSPDVLSYTYTEIKDLIHLTWQDDRQNTDELGQYGVKLISQIYKAPNPDSGDGNSLVEDLSKISAALNLALYLVLRDKRRSSPYTTEMAKYIREYIEPVGSLLKSEMERLMAHLDELTDESDNIAEERSSPTCSLTIGDNTLSHNKQLETEATEAAIAKLDLVLFNHNLLEQTLES